jgi:signal transduction histidine kinase
MEAVTAHPNLPRGKKKVSVDCPKGLTVVSDASFLREILRNLVNNAMKYTSDGGTIRISAHRTGSGTELRVRDSGVGIPRDQHARIFTKFFRASNAVTSHTEGSGLGLYLVSLLTSILGGRIDFTSEVGKGTEFCVLLPSRADMTGSVTMPDEVDSSAIQ